MTIVDAVIGWERMTTVDAVIGWERMTTVDAVIGWECMTTVDAIIGWERMTTVNAVIGSDLILKKLPVKMNTCRKRVILAIDTSDKLLPRLLICASDRERERSLASKMMPWSRLMDGSV